MGQNNCLRYAHANRITSNKATAQRNACKSNETNWSESRICEYGINFALCANISRGVLHQSIDRFIWTNFISISYFLRSQISSNFAANGSKWIEMDEFNEMFRSIVYENPCENQFLIPGVMHSKLTSPELWLFQNHLFSSLLLVLTAWNTKNVRYVETCTHIRMAT